MSAIATAGANLAGQVVGQGMGMILGGIGHKSALRRNADYQKQQMDANKSMAIFQKEQDLDMWNKTNAEAQKEHYKKAGLNPALMYKGSGAGGATTGGTGMGVDGNMADTAGDMMKASVGMGIDPMQANLMRAQADNLDANTEKTKGVDTAKVTTEIESLKQGVVNQQAIQKLTVVETNLKEVELDLANDTFEEVRNEITWKARTAYENLRIAGNEADMSDETYKAKVGMVNQSLINAQLTALEKKKGMQLMDATMKKMVQDVAQGWADIRVAQTNSEINKENAKSNRINANSGNWNASTQALRQKVDEFYQKIQIELQNRGLDQQGAQNFMRNNIEIMSLGLGKMGGSSSTSTESIDGSGNWRTTRSTTNHR